jgi:anti-sigma regulatory factor (Ser/Thr protein kinase)
MTRDDDVQAADREITDGPNVGAPVLTPDHVALDQAFDLSGLYPLRAAVAAHATELGLHEQHISGLLIAATELATNAIRHGGGTGRLRMWRTDVTLHVQVSDDGPGITDPHLAGTRPVPLTAVGGRGLWIVRQLCDHLHIATMAGATITASFDLSPLSTNTRAPNQH